MPHEKAGYAANLMLTSGVVCMMSPHACVCTIKNHLFVCLYKYCVPRMGTHLQATISNTDEGHYPQSVFLTATECAEVGVGCRVETTDMHKLLWASSSSSRKSS